MTMALSTVLLYTYPLGLYAVLSTGYLIEGRNRVVFRSNRVENVITIVWVLQLIVVASLVGLLPDPNGQFHPSVSHLCAWIFAIGIEIVLLINGRHHDGGKLQAELPLQAVRIAAIAGMCLLSALAHVQNRKDIDKHDTDSLIRTEDPPSFSYGATDAKNQPHQAKNPSRSPQIGWLDYFVGFRILFPYIWPSGSWRQQLILILSLCLMIGQRIINILVPYQLGVLIESVGLGKMAYKEILVYILYRGLQGQQGVLGSFRAIVWIPVSQSLFRRLTCAAFEHVLSLSLEFHLSKRIGEVLSALNKGSALNTFLDSFAFQLFPMVFDLAVAAVYFMIRLDVLYSLILIGVMWTYVYMTIYMAQWRAKARREMAMKDREMDATKMDTMMSYETVHHNDAVPVEVERFGEHVAQFQSAEFSVLFSLNALNIAQNLVLVFGTLLVVLLSTLQISVGMHTVAMFVSVLAYFTQLQAPLQFFGSFYTQVQNNLVDAERMLGLFKLQPSITDSPNAVPLTTCNGRIHFAHVSFSYDSQRAALSDVSFTIEPGTSTAIVGESGSGKSTCLKLLFRFYDVCKGSISVDGHDIRHLTLGSYRKHIGVVPQDTILFNTSLMFNLQYAKPGASEQEIIEACRIASIHDRILSFPLGYQTMVGERGLRLSGGEKQRIAIARAILKNPQIMLLDEATASLDSHTERQIQTSVEAATNGRTTVTIAHRLSTITKCQQILVMHEGCIVERGTHEELLEAGGRYCGMWYKQTVAGPESE
ncbi:putative transport protein [Clohesyomyces aquaticus]|uniref:Putative transport protein n=1 Tax=Clohesyomyces aquaticus TaxID=1231657 RepID=A0A1Y1ZWL6_9PLEO|nr:putative transport protein [Clohesyomyces aquaticus]